MAKKADAVVRSIEEATYRCPGCGEMVDKRQIDQVLQHHRHVLMQEYPPAWFSEVPHLSHTSSNAQATTQSTQAPAQQQSSTSGSAEAQRRRYGHCGA